MSGWARAAAMIALLLAGACRHPAGAPEHDAAAPRACGPADPCGSGEYCVYTPGLCGKGRHPGTCQPRPESCPAPVTMGPQAAPNPAPARPALGEPVCGCDGQVHESACAAHAAGVDLAVMGGCGHAVPSFVACGAHYCDARTSYCEIDLSDVLEPPTDYVCKPLPPSCVPDSDSGVARDCSCFPQGTRCLSFCGHVEGPGLQGFHLTCRR